MTDPSKPNNKIANPYASYITDTLVGYFVGEPITYTSENEALMEQIKDCLEYNDEADENMEIAKDCSIYGVGYEMLYVDEDKQLRFKNLDPRECIPVYDKGLQHDLLAFIRLVLNVDMTSATDKEYYVVEIITDKEIYRYTTSTAIGELKILTPPEIHYFGMVPIAIYKNNEELTGDFEKVVSLIDAYDKMESDTLNDFEYFVDCYLALSGFTADPEDIAQMKENRVLLLDEGTDAKWLTKNVSDTHVENLKNRLDANIHKFSKCPDMSDENFASNASGVAIKYKLLGTENVVAIKERKFKKGLQHRFEIMSNFFGLLNQCFDWRDIKITFTRNIPSNDADIANVINQLKDVVSTETLLAQIPFVDDVQEEMDRLEKEKADNPFYAPLANYMNQEVENNREEEVVNEEN